MSEVVASPTATATSPRTAKRTARAARYVFWLMTIFAFLNYVDRYLFLGLTRVIQTDIGLTNLEIGLLGSSSFLIVYTLFALPLGLLADRVSRKGIVSAGVAVWSVATIFTGLAGTFVGLAAARGLLGIGEASYLPAGGPLVSAHFPPARRAKVFARWGSAALVGVAVGFLLAGVFAKPMVWRYAFFFAGAPGIIFAGLMLLAREKRRHEDDPPVEQIGAGSHSFIARAREYLRIPTFRVILGMHALGYFGVQAIVAFLTIYLSLSYGGGKGEPYPAGVGLSDGAVALLAGLIIVVGGVVGTLGGGAWSDRLSRRRPGARVLTGGLGFLLSAPVVALSTAVPFLLRLVPGYQQAAPSAQVTIGVATYLPLALVATVFLNVYIAPVGAALQDVIPAAERGAAGGTEVTLANLLGAVYAAAVVGLLADFLGGIFGSAQVGLGVALLVTAPPALLLSGLVGMLGSRFYARDVAKLGTTAEAMLGTATP